MVANNIKLFSYMMFYTTPHCNMSCPKCMRKMFAPEMKSEVTWSEFINSMHRWRDLATPETLVFTGGEPTLWGLLKAAIMVAKYNYNIPKVVVATNGIDRDAADYGIADLVRVSNYGSINRMDMLRLKRQLGKRFQTINSTQLRLPFEVHQDSLPAKCNCAHICSVKDKVWPCGGAIGRVPGISNEEDYISQFLKMDIFNQEICKNCYANTNVRKFYEPGPTLELSIWNYGTAIFGLKSHCTKLRESRKWIKKKLKIA